MARKYISRGTGRAYRKHTNGALIYAAYNFEPTLNSLTLLLQVEVIPPFCIYHYT